MLHHRLPLNIILLINAVVSIRSTKSSSGLICEPGSYILNIVQNQDSTNLGQCKNYVNYLKGMVMPLKTLKQQYLYAI